MVENLKKQELAQRMKSLSCQLSEARGALEKSHQYHTNLKVRSNYTRSFTPKSGNHYPRGQKRPLEGRAVHHSQQWKIRATTPVASAPSVKSRVPAPPNVWTRPGTEKAPTSRVKHWKKNPTKLQPSSAKQRNTLNVWTRVASGAETATATHRAQLRSHYSRASNKAGFPQSRRYLPFHARQRERILRRWRLTAAATKSQTRAVSKRPGKQSAMEYLYGSVYSRSANGLSLVRKLPDATPHRPKMTITKANKHLPIMTPSSKDLNETTAADTLKQARLHLAAGGHIARALARHKAARKRDTKAKRSTGVKGGWKKTAKPQPAVEEKPREPCVFFSRNGSCLRGEECPYVHDKSRVLVCRAFLKGACNKGASCLLSHDTSLEKMPVCSAFLQGMCGNPECPYRHVKVNRKARLCPDFLKGKCPKGDSCPLKHQLPGSKRKKESLASASLQKPNSMQQPLPPSDKRTIVGVENQKTTTIQPRQTKVRTSPPRASHCETIQISVPDSSPEVTSLQTITCPVNKTQSSGAPRPLNDSKAGMVDTTVRRGTSYQPQPQQMTSREERELSTSGTMISDMMTRRGELVVHTPAKAVSPPPCALDARSSDRTLSPSPLTARTCETTISSTSTAPDLVVTKPLSLNTTATSPPFHSPLHDTSPRKSASPTHRKPEKLLHGGSTDTPSSIESGGNNEVKEKTERRSDTLLSRRLRKSSSSFDGNDDDWIRPSFMR